MMTEDAPARKRGRPRSKLTQEEALERDRNYRNEYNKAKNAQARDIGPLRDCVDAARRDSCERDFRLFCETYLAGTFPLKWSPDHLAVIALIEKAVLNGELFAFAMARGSGKTSLCEAACIWALVYAHRKFIVLIGSDADAACGMLSTIRAELESNDLLDEDFPEVCQPIRALEGIAHRANGQVLDGERTVITWNTDETVLPVVRGYETSGSIVKVCGITGRIRGLAHKTHDGRKLRPDLVIVDDPQTDESANSQQQCATREAVLNGAILGLAGPGKKIAGFMPCTVIRPGDLADTILDRKKYPLWQGKRFRLLAKFPTNMKLWEEYAEIRQRLLEAEMPLQEATDFYLANRAAMDEGADIAWEERKTDEEVSAIQHAMHLYFRNPSAFMSEYNNDPQAKLLDGEADPLVVADILRKLVRREQMVCPIWATRLTAFIDVGQEVLYYAVVAWDDKFNGHICDFGTYPDQRVEYFRARDVRKKLSELLPNQSPEAVITEGLRRCVQMLVQRKYQREDNIQVNIDKIGIDANWKTDTIYEFCKVSEYSSLLIPSQTVGITARMTPITYQQPKPGERVGLHWRMPLGGGKRAIRSMRWDTNFWKTFVKDRFKTPAGGSGSLSVFGDDPNKLRTRLFADHMTAEYFTRTAGQGREVEEWEIRPERFDNHWWDCVVGASVLASIQGVSLPEVAASLSRQRERLTLSEIQKKKREGRL